MAVTACAARGEVAGLPFSFVPAGHRLRGRLDDVLEGVDQRRAGHPAGTVRTVAEIKGRRAGATWGLDRVYCSLQGHAGPETSPFAASTLHWSATSPEEGWWDYPVDPYLGNLQPCLRSFATGPHEVLRYVPLRRFTFRANGRVVKVKRPSRLLDSYRRVAAVRSAAAGGDVRVPELGPADVTRSCYVQASVPGTALAALAEGERLLGLLAEAGQVHAAFHALPDAGLPAGPGPDGIGVLAVEAVDWASEFLPEHVGLLRRARAVMLAPPPRTADVTCHGDLVPSHLIGAPGQWTVIDLDLAHRGDPYRDVAMFLAGLPADVPALADGIADPPTLLAAEGAYLGGYCERSGEKLDPGGLAWHRLAAELHHLGLLVSKDRMHPASVARITATLSRLLDEVEPCPA